MKHEIARRIAIPTFTDERGSLSVLELKKVIPFPVERIFYLHGMPPEAARGNHATFSPEFLVCAAGSCRVRLCDGQTEREELFSPAEEGLFIPPLTWRSFSAFSRDCLLICFSDRPYREDDTIRDFDRFLQIKNAAEGTV